jgi:hypothetical protein
MGFCPDNGEREFFLSGRHLEHLLKNGPAHVFFALQSVLEVIRQPDVIYKDLKRNGLEEGLCYVGKPKQYGDGWSAPPAKGMVFLVCSNHDVIFEWRWEMADIKDSGKPQDEKRRFGKVIWTR